MSQMSYFGWHEEWFDSDSKPKVNEIFITYFVNRYFTFPEDWDKNDIPLIMIWTRCTTCGAVKEHYMADISKEWDNFLYNWDNTYTSISNPECEEGCNWYSSPWNGGLEKHRQEQSRFVEEYYRRFSLDQLEEIELQVESPLEEWFWKNWLMIGWDITLIPQYSIGNYRLDFAHLSTKTAIEIDGNPYHSTPDQIAYDRMRQTEIEQKGWRFLRFRGVDVHYHVDKCIVETLRFLANGDGNLLYQALPLGMLPAGRTKNI